jgi:hypothetical protein
MKRPQKVNIESVMTKLDYIHRDIKQLQESEKLNTEFRIQAKGVVGTITFVASIFGGFIVWLAGKIFSR